MLKEVRAIVNILRIQLADSLTLIRKEVRSMEYTKPEVAVLEPAVDAVQDVFKSVVYTDGPTPLSAGPAYEADE